MWSSIPLSGGESPLGLDPRVAAAELPDPQHQHRHQPLGGGPVPQVFFRRCR